MTSRDDERSIRQLHEFDPSVGLRQLNRYSHPFLQQGTPDEYQKKYREVEGFIREWLQNESKVPMAWDAAMLAQELMAPESDDERLQG
jgi:hypothetical protein